MYRLLLLVIALILYGSLYPWNFHPRILEDNPLRLLLDGWPSRLDRFTLRDVFINVVLYIPLGATAFLTFVRALGAVPGLLLAAGLGAAVSTGIEIAQLFDAGRTASAFDVLNNFIGTTAGAVFAWAFGPHLRRLLARRHALAAAPSAAFLLLLFIAFQVYPLFPSFSQHALAAKLLGFVHLSFSAATLAGAIAGWLAVAFLLEALRGESPAPAPLLLLFLLLPARFLIAGPPPVAMEFAGAAAALLLALLLPESPLLRYRMGAAILLAALLLRGLAPFHFQAAAGPFSWIPFAGSMEMEWQSGIQVLLRKVFDYGSAVWLTRLSGLSYTRAAALVAVVLAGVEFAQRWLPGRVAESTDPLLAILAAFALWRIEKELAVQEIPFRSHALCRP